MNPNIPHTCWLRVPDERSAEFLPSFVRISVAIQTVLRAQVPVRYFEDSARFRDLKTAGPMLIYQASPPFRGKKRAELTYDVLNPALIAMLFRRAKLNLPELLAQTEARLVAEGLPELADQYAPRRSDAIPDGVQKLSRSRRHLYVLIRGESVLVDALVQLSGFGELSRKAQSKRWAALEKRWMFHLKRLYQGCDFSYLAPILLEVAEKALVTEDVPLLDEPDPA